MAALIVLLLAVAVALIFAARWKLTSRDARSVETYHTALEHLRHIDGGSPAPAETHVRVVPETQLRFEGLSQGVSRKRKPAALPTVAASANGLKLERQALPTVGLRVNGKNGRTVLPKVSPPAVGQKTVFVDESGTGPAPVIPAQPEPAPEVRALPSGPRRAVRNFPSFKSPVLRMASVAAASALVAVIATLALESGGGPAAKHEPSPTTPTARSAPKTGGAPSPARHAAAPAQPAPLAVSSSVSSATYDIASNQFDLSLVAVGRCWVELRSGSATGPVLFRGTLVTGEQKTFPALAGLWLEIGYPAGLDVMVNGTVLPVPHAGTPYEVTVEGSAPSTA